MKFVVTILGLEFRLESRSFKVLHSILTPIDRFTSGLEFSFNLKPKPFLPPGSQAALKAPLPWVSPEVRGVISKAYVQG